MHKDIKFYKDSGQFIIFCEGGCGEPVGLFFPVRNLTDEELYYHTHTGYICDFCLEKRNNGHVNDELGIILPK